MMTVGTADMPTRSKAVLAPLPTGLRRWIPGLDLIATYQRAWLPKDVVAYLVKPLNPLMLKRTAKQIVTPPPAQAGTAQSPRRYLSGQVIVGAGIILLGLLLLLDNLGVLDARDFTQFWPVILIVLGLLSLLQPVKPGSRIWGAILLFLGVVFLLRTMGLAYLHMRDVWPIILLIVGVGLIWGSSTRSRSAIRKEAAGAPDSYIVGSAILGGFSRSSNAKDFRGGDLTAIMGGCEIDLRLAEMQGDEAVINTFAFWGGIEIKVPQSWSVHVRGTPILGGFGDETLQPSQPGAKRLVLTGTAIMGGVEVRN